MVSDTVNAQRTAAILRRTRRASGLSLREAASIAGTSHATLLAYETGKKIPSVVVFLRVLDACNVSVDIVTEPRIRQRDGIPRGEELVSVLRLAEQFPASAARQLPYPKLSQRG
jgi:transcriptional regulator with XRE-family HTH domain